MARQQDAGVTFRPPSLELPARYRLGTMVGGRWRGWDALKHAPTTSRNGRDWALRIRFLDAAGRARCATDHGSGSD